MVDERTHIFRAGDAPFALPLEIGTRAILTGAKNAGKTTTLVSWIDGWRAQGFSLSGVYTRTVFEDENHIGYDLIDISSGTSYPAIRTSPFKNSWQQGSFFFDVDCFDALVQRIGAGTPTDLFILDEIGPLEFRHHAGLYPLLHRSLQSGQPLLLVVRDAYLEELSVFL
jgi:nucleoside-triphosphatase THEP1